MCSADEIEILKVIIPLECASVGTSVKNIMLSFRDCFLISYIAILFLVLK